MSVRDLIVVGTSAGGVETLSHVVRGLPAAFPATMFIVCHCPAGFRSMLPEILSRAGPLLATHAADGERFYPGHIYVAPPDLHLLLAPDGHMRLSREARENHHRPSADPLFRSAARHYGPRVIGVILSGSLHDGTAGLMAIRAAGGVAVVQDPSDALLAAMPEHAAQIAGADHVAPADAMAHLLVKLLHDYDIKERRGGDVDPIEHIPETRNRDMGEQVRNERRGMVSVFTCPDCGGSLWQVDDATLIRFRCHVGHAYDGEILLSEQSEALEAALWTSIRTFREKAVLARQMAERERKLGNPTAAERYDEVAGQAERYGSVIHEFLVNGDTAWTPRESSSVIRFRSPVRLDNVTEVR